MKKYFILFCLSFSILASWSQKPSKWTLRKWGISFSYSLPVMKRYALIKTINEMVHNQSNKQYLSAARFGAGVYVELNGFSLDDKTYDPEFRSKYAKYKYYAYFLNLLSNSLNSVGQYSDALYFGLEAERCWDQISSKKKKNKTVDYMHAMSMKDLAVFYFNSRDINESNKWIDRCIEHTKGKSGYENLYYEILNTKACIFDYDGMHAKALELEETILNNAPNVLPIWESNYINFLYHNKQKDNAIIQMEDFIQKQKSHGHEYSSDYASYLNKLAIFKAEKDVNESISLLQEALKILEGLGSTLGGDYARCLSNLACFYNIAGRKKEALVTEMRAYAIWSIISYDSYPDRLTSLFNLSLYQFENNEWAYAERNAIKGTKFQDENIRYSMMQSREVRNGIWEKTRGWYMTSIPRLSYHIQSDSLNITAYNAALLSKGILLNTEQSLQEIAENGGEQTKRLYNEWQESLRLLNTTHSIDTKDSLKIASQEAEETFIRHCRTLENAQMRLSVKWDDVQKTLGKGDVAIEFCSFEENGETQYMALVLTKDIPFPKNIPLFSEKQLQDIKENYVRKETSRLVWKPLYEYLKSAKRVYFAPSGELYSIAIENLPHWDEDCMVCDKWDMYRLSSTRELVFTKDRHDYKKASVYGGIKYDTGMDILVTESKKHFSQKNLFLQNNIPYEELALLRSGFNYLPASKKEAENIDRILKQNGIFSDLMTDDRATESAIKQLSGKRNDLLHIATHGFYITNDESVYGYDLPFLSIDNQQMPQKINDDALSRSGLLFAGANNILGGNKVPENVDDGILTAKEVAQLDLRGLDLVVLSACKTGLGEITGDGVFGLQRGFKKAGANSLLMSLWKVDDDATQMLMTEFYRNLTSGKMSKYESLKQAQKYVREYEVRIPKDESSPQKGYEIIRRYENPIYWAAFILLDALEY